jgi:hypothetical protein
VQHIAPPEAMELYNCSQPYTYFCQTFDAEDRYSAGLMAFLYVPVLCGRGYCMLLQFLYSNNRHVAIHGSWNVLVGH